MARGVNMTLKELKRDVLALIEELNADSEYLTDDPDIQAKINSVINQVQLELCRMKKITAYSTESVTGGEVYELNDLDDFYQLKNIRTNNESSYEIIDNMVIFAEDCEATFFYYKYPKMITEETADTYKFELSKDALGILPYGVASKLLKSDVSAQYGATYTQEYETMLQRLDSRYSTGSVHIEGGGI